MIVLNILFLVNLIIGGIFVRKYILKKSSALACTIFLGAYSLILFYFISLKLPLGKIVIFFPLVFLPFIFLHFKIDFQIKKLWPKNVNVYTYLLSLLVIVILFFGILHIMKEPIFERDGIGIWLTKAKMIYLDKTIYTENFLDPHRIHDHPRYPLFLPILEAAYFFTNGINERTVKIITVFIWFLILGVLFETLYKKSSNMALLSLILLSSIPAYYTMLDGSLDTGYADIPLSLFYLCTYIFLYNYFISGNKKFVIWAGLSLAFSIFTKNEGYAFAISVFLLLLFTKKKNIDIVLLLACLIIPLVPWFIVRTHFIDLYAEHYLSHISEMPSHMFLIPIILKNAFFEIINFRHWGFFWLLALFVFIYPKYKIHTVYLLFLTAMLLVFYLGIFLLTPWSVNLQMKIVFPRMLLHISPSIVFLIFHHSLTSRPCERHTVK